MKNIQRNTLQTSFDFDAIMTTPVELPPSSPLLMRVMTHLADRLHHKIDMMREKDHVNNEVSLIIKQDDKEMIIAALEADAPHINNAQLATLRDVAHMARDADKKLFLTYDQVEQLFLAVSH